MFRGRARSRLGRGRAAWITCGMLALGLSSRWALPAARGQEGSGAARAPEAGLPPPRDEYMGRRIAPTMHWLGAEWLLRETRENEEHTSRMIEALEIGKGAVVCDLGCGVGYITLPLARLVGAEGRVLAVDIQHEMLERLAVRARAAGVGNVRLILAGLADPRLEPASCDLVLMVDVYHELGFPEHVLAAVRRALKPGGRLVLVEFRAEDPAVPIKPEHKMSRAQVQLELSANGYRLERSFEDLPWQHMLFYVRDEGAEREPAGR